MSTDPDTPPASDNPSQTAPRYFRTPARRRRWPWIVGYTLWGILGVVLAIGWGVDRAAQHLIDQISPNTASVAGARQVLAATTGPDTTFVILGSDHRSWLPGAGGLSDSIVLVHLDPPKNLISIMSVPRDLAVTLPGYAVPQKINAAYSYGGPKLSIQTLQNTLGIKINHYAVVSFAGFFKIVQHLGGLYTQVDRQYYNPLGTSYSPINIQPGYQRLNGNDALAFARFRHTDTDIVRAARQQQIILDLKRQASTQLGFTDIPLILDTVGGSIETDVNSLSTLTNIGQFLLGLPHGRIFHSTLQVGFATIGGGSYDVATPTQIADSVQEFLHPAGAATQGMTQTPTAPSTSGPSVATPVTPTTVISPKSAHVVIHPNALPAGLIVDPAPAQALRGLGQVGLPLLVPTLTQSNSRLDVTEVPVRKYKIEGGPNGGWPSVVAVFANSMAAGSYYDVQETTMPVPPVMQNPTRVIRTAGRVYDLFQDGKVLRYVGFNQNGVWYWVSNSFDGVLTPAQMVAIAASLRPASAPVGAPRGVGLLTKGL